MPQGLVRHISLPVVVNLPLEVPPPLAAGSLDPRQVHGDHAVRVARVQAREVPAQGPQKRFVDVRPPLRTTLSREIDDTDPAPRHLIK
eukprot:CAMPEP_0203917308 /NCGR_PEP_ID=MMETSP0359-20131031/57954_1 /ASSEMBLY_ACC=CAM_ASM_000338 /TAXON_ID=268821 /ORGANISM="Scrippsiella Hangoei, Strain SHTV-5" /LENGTH=87 /DNA_ID=CAMNT_0050844189 /DNA_START=314 /DNA_END=574 /DNA_ORIENTATION=-